MMEDKTMIERIDALVERLNEASAAYYNGQDEIMSNYEWDSMLDEMTASAKESENVRRDRQTKSDG